MPTETTDDPPLTVLAPTSGQGEVGRQALLIAMSTVAVSVANYLFALVVIRLLSAADYVDYASVQSFLLVLGTGCMAAVPWAMAQYLARERTLTAQAAALRFGVVASVVQGIVFAGLSLIVVVPTAGWGLAASTALAALTMSLVAAPLGLLQGTQRIGSIALLRLLETAVRLSSSVLLLVVAATPQAPVIGFSLGSAVLLVVALLLCRRAWSAARTPADLMRDLLRRSAGFAVMQVALAALGAVDTVVITYAGLDDASASAYQISALLGRIPLFLSAAIALSWFQRIAGAHDDAEARRGLRGAAEQYLLLATPAALGVLGAPAVVLAVLAPERGHDLWALTPWTAGIGWGVGLLTILVTEHQARSRVRRAVFLLVPIAAVQPLALVASGRTLGVLGYAASGALLVALSIALVVGDLGVSWLRLRLRSPRLLMLGLGVVTACLSRFEPWIWPPSVAVLAVVVASAVLPSVRRARAQEAELD